MEEAKLHSVDLGNPDMPLPPKAPTPEEIRRKHYANFCAELNTKSKRELMKMLFEACEAMSFQDRRIAELTEPTPEASPCQIPEKIEKVTLKKRVSKLFGGSK